LSNRCKEYVRQRIGDGNESKNEVFRCMEKNEVIE
jgi:hypothetical protein